MSLAQTLYYSKRLRYCNVSHNDLNLDSTILKRKITSLIISFFVFYLSKTFLERIVLVESYFTKIILFYVNIIFESFKNFC